MVWTFVGKQVGTKLQWAKAVQSTLQRLSGNSADRTEAVQTLFMGIARN